MSVLIKGMDIPATGLYFVSVDNTGGRDKTVVTVERMLSNSGMRNVVGSFELVTIPTPHGKLVDTTTAYQNTLHLSNRFQRTLMKYINELPTVIEREE